MGLDDTARAVAIEAGDRDLTIEWSDGSTRVHSYVALRRDCRCASCVEEMTRRPLLDPASVSDDIHPVEIRRVGLYAIQIVWSDGHSTGIYSFDHLRAMPEG